MRIEHFEKAEALYGAAAGTVAEALAQAVEQRGVASFVATGGSTPAPVYERLSRADLAWERVQVTLSDERWVDAASADSNERLVRDRLLTGRAAAAKFTPLKTADGTATEAEARVGAALARMARPFDVVLLGVGEDGHVASLFPCGEWFAGTALVHAVEAPGAAGSSERMTLTPRALVDARRIVVLARGAKKRAVLEGGDPGLPVQRLLAAAGTKAVVLLGR